ncbi:hypothetical protein VKT23_014827 [Stygiomarasmius scandens]|uniref:Uncharacterized protein n=1 Tax=Marasmiellus scandens TaxID=2682957 RepID=A0ABR1IZF1_9AGAR
MTMYSESTYTLQHHSPSHVTGYGAPYSDYLSYEQYTGNSEEHSGQANDNYVSEYSSWPRNTSGTFGHSGLGFNETYPNQWGQGHLSQLPNQYGTLPTTYYQEPYVSQYPVGPTPPLLSPPSQQSPPGGSSPATPSSTVHEEPLPPTTPQVGNRPLYSHREQLQFFREALLLPSSPMAGPFIPQQMYKPHTNSDRRRYVEEVDLDFPIYFWSEHPTECGITLSDALHSRVKRLTNRDETVFEGRGPSVSIRLEWPGYRQWSRQIPTRDFRSPPGPITKAKLAKNVAKCVQRFIAERQGHPPEDESDARWRIGTGPGLNHIRFEDLVLVSIHHVSMGSWQPQLRLSRPFPAFPEGSNQ